MKITTFSLNNVIITTRLFKNARIHMNKVRFSVLLDYLIKNHTYNNKKLAQETGIDRTVIQKYISGARLPSSYDNIEIIADKLTLSKEERNMLYDAYKIEKVGYEKYEQLKLIKKIIENISYPKKIDDYDFDISYQFDNINHFATTHQSLLILVRYVIDQAKKGSDHNIYAYLPYNTDIIDLISDNLNSSSPLYLNLLTNIITVEKAQIDNIKKFENLLPLIFLDNTQIRYQYENLSLIQETNFSYPYCISSSNCSLLINSNLSSGILIENEGNNYILEQFKETYDKSMLFCQNINTAKEIIKYYNSESKNINYIRSFSYEPCIVPCLDIDLINKRYQGPKEYSKQIIDFLIQYKNQELQYIKNGSKFSFYFTKSGLQSFYDTGRVSEIPNQFYHPFSKNDVILLLSRTLNLARNYDSYRFYLIDEAKFNIPNKFSLVLNDETEALITLGGDNNDTSVNIAILEPILRREFCSLIELIDLEDSYYDFEYSFNYIQKFIDSHK